MPIRFQVDPDFYDHPKTINISDAAVALWVRAGSYSAAKLSDGFIADDVLAHTLRYGVDVADELTRRGLWLRVRGGYRFRQWDQRNLTRARVEDYRSRDRERKREDRQPTSSEINPQVEDQIVRKESTGSPNGFQPESDRIPPPVVLSSVVSVLEGGGGLERNSPTVPTQAPPGTCKQHKDDPDPPACRRCAMARERHEAWQAARRARVQVAPECPHHRGELAANCRACRSEQIAAQEVS